MQLNGGINTTNVGRMPDEIGKWSHQEAFWKIERRCLPNFLNLATARIFRCASVAQSNCPQIKPRGTTPEAHLLNIAYKAWGRHNDWKRENTSFFERAGYILQAKDSNILESCNKAAVIFLDDCRIFSRFKCPFLTFIWFIMCLDLNLGLLGLDP